MRLKDKVAIVTGAGSGFGEGIAKLYAQEGAMVVVNDLSEAGGNRVVAEIDKAQGQGTAIFVKADVSRDADVKALVEKTLATFGRLDIMVNNAGYTHKNKPMLEVTEEEFDRCFAVNTKAIFLSAKYAVPVFRKQGKGG
ncbi:MAG: SDR family NAD(P)-dependent oxidoreductase, partial [Alphaproteobacteria bacterium]|nr:SDR family NAD(P)-dependent oxidoreductase [Alphaproteobacteria bacterium]